MSGATEPSLPSGMRGDFPAIMKVIKEALLGNDDRTENITAE